MTDRTSRAEHPDRRGALLDATYHRIAEGGLEGLRTRDVAGDAGVNVATLHYYFPTKEALVRGVVSHAMAKFAAAIPREGSAREQLRAHLGAVRRLMREEPALWAVLSELSPRAARDPQVAAIVRPAERAWEAKVRQLLERSVAEGGDAGAFDPCDAAALVVSTIRGAGMPGVEELRAARLERTFDQLERWLGLAPA